MCAAVAAQGAAVPMPATTPEEIIALAHRTYEYVARSVPERELSALKDELAIDEKWYADAKKANDAMEMRNAVRELKSVRRRILFKHPDLQFKRLLAVQRGLPLSQETGTADQYAGRWSRPGPGLVAIDNWQEQKRLEAAQADDRIKDTYRRRAAVIGYRCGVIFMLLVGKESNASVDFALTMAEYTLQNQCRLFGPLLQMQNEKVKDRMPLPHVNKNVLQQLPSPFTLEDLKQLKGNGCSDGSLYSIISRWKAEGWILKKDKSTWEKTETLQSCNLA
jgi:hypothetical protein